MHLELKRGDKGDHWTSSAWERPYRSVTMNSLCPTSQSDLTRSLTISSFWSDPKQPPRATTRSRSSSRARSPQRHPEVATATPRGRHSDTPRSLGFVSMRHEKQAGSDVPREIKDDYVRAMMF
uniref:Uncharacterized protein n=1 Tax=Brassica oleracea var. oleracea TaxID=109376 RepID=A0A0D3DIT6_BRAOL